jgi:hypothetical protein
MAKSNTLLYLALAGGAAYFLLPKAKQAVDNAINAINPLNAASGALSGATAATAQGLEEAKKQITALTTSQPLVSAGGAVAQIINPAKYGLLSSGAASVIANVDYINAASGGNVIKTSITPTASGSGLITLTPTAGAKDVSGNAAIDTAVRAATAPTYGVQLASGGTQVFNITSKGTAATTALSSPSAIASALARGLV